MSVVALPRRRWLGRSRLRLVTQRVIPRQVSFLAGAVVIVSLLVLAIVSLQAVLSETSFKMRELTTRTAELESSYSRLKLTVAELSSPQRVADEARKLGLRLPTNTRTLPVDLPASFERSTPTSFRASLAPPAESEGRP